MVKVPIWSIEGTQIPSTEPTAKVVARPDRPLRTNHVVAEAHGTTPDHVKESDFDGHILADKQLNPGDQKRSTVNDATDDRHHVSEDQLGVVAKRGAASIETNRKDSAKIFDRDRLSVSRQGKYYGPGNWPTIF